VRFEILGPLRVLAAAEEVTVTAGRDRVLLAMLLLYPGRSVSVDELVDAIWGDQPPTRARNQVQKCVLRPRRCWPPPALWRGPALAGLDRDPVRHAAEAWTSNADRSRPTGSRSSWRSAALANSSRS
jgi:hypothetical protein